LIEFLKDYGYEIGTNLHGAPYDWRLTGNEHSIKYENEINYQNIGG